MSAHTPGPWKVAPPVESGTGKSRHIVYIGILAGETDVGTTGVYLRDRQGNARGKVKTEFGEPRVQPTLSDAECLANARLIAAAPDLLEALRVLVERVEHYAPAMAREGDLDAARAALKKARGE